MVLSICFLTSKMNFSQPFFVLTGLVMGHELVNNNQSKKNINFTNMISTQDLLLSLSSSVLRNISTGYIYSAY